MSSDTLNYQQFIQTIESSENFESISKLAQVSQLRRRGSNLSIYSQNSIAYSVASAASNKLAVPSATDLDSALYQKGFELRGYDSGDEFDLIVEQGFHGSVGECMTTLKLTLTPDLLRN
jgi:hypothetical protein